jgi:hypothetical protein
MMRPRTVEPSRADCAYRERVTQGDVVALSDTLGTNEHAPIAQDAALRHLGE